MTRGMVYKLLFILFVIFFSVALILPTVGEKRMQVYFLPEAAPEMIQKVEKRFSAGSYTIEKKDGTIIISGGNLTDAIMNEIRTYEGVRNASFLKHWAEQYLLAKKINLGLDLQGGMHLVMRADFEKFEKKTGKALSEADKNEITQQALELIRNRIDKFGVAEPSIRPRGAEAIEIQMPGVRDPEGVKKAIGTTGRVEYKLVDDGYSKQAADWLQANYKEKTLPEEKEKFDELVDRISQGIKLPAEMEVLFYYVRDINTKKIVPSYPIVLEKKASIAGPDISKAWVGNDEYGGLAVHFTTTPEGATKFADVTSQKNHGRRLAIVIDDKVRSAPSLNVQITSGQAMINGDFTQEEVQTLARIIKEGALPVDLKIIEERTVGPSLGQDSIESGVKAVIVGLSGVMLFMLVYYKMAGLIADIGLLLNAVFQLALLSWMGFTLTLPGIAGIILSAGMAVDANVLIYERMKEELKAGKSVRMSIIFGFDRAFWAIFDSNLTTMLAAFILSQYGTGPIKGFAVTLFIGLLSSMFVALYITRFIYDVISLNKKQKKLSI